MFSTFLRYTALYFYDLQFTTKYIIPSFHSFYVQFHTCYVQGGRSIQVKIAKKDTYRTPTGWPLPLNRGGRLIQVTNTAFVWAKNRDFENWPLNRGWPLNTGPLYSYRFDCSYHTVCLFNLFNITFRWESRLHNSLVCWPSSWHFVSCQCSACHLGNWGHLIQLGRLLKKETVKGERY